MADRGVVSLYVAGPYFSWVQATVYRLTLYSNDFRRRIGHFCAAEVFDALAVSDVATESQIDRFGICRIAIRADLRYGNVLPDLVSMIVSRMAD
jgi:hypothetical protein